MKTPEWNLKGTTMSKPKRTKHELRLEAELMAGRWLARANELAEAGKDDTKAMRHAQRWLDRLNTLEGIGPNDY